MGWMGEDTSGRKGWPGSLFGLDHMWVDGEQTTHTSAVRRSSSGHRLINMVKQQAASIHLVGLSTGTCIVDGNKQTTEAPEHDICIGKQQAFIRHTRDEVDADGEEDQGHLDSHPQFLHQVLRRLVVAQELELLPRLRHRHPCHPCCSLMAACCLFEPSLKRNPGGWKAGRTIPPGRAGLCAEVRVYGLTKDECCGWFGHVQI